MPAAPPRTSCARDDRCSSTRPTYEDLVEQGEIEQVGARSEGWWLGAPLRTEGHTLGAIVVQTYSANEGYSEDDRDLLTFVGQHIATALSRARAIEETRERNAELAVINEIGDALARQLDFQAIIELSARRSARSSRRHDGHHAVRRAVRPHRVPVRA